MNSPKLEEIAKNQIIEVNKLINDIPTVIDDFCIQHNIKDLKTESANLYNALLIAINKTLIQPNKHLFKYPQATNNKYNPDTVYLLCEWYITSAMLYDAPVTLSGFSLLLDIKRDAIYQWQYETEPQEATSNITKESYKPRRTGADIWEKIREYEEMTTLNCKKYNDLRIIARLNRITGGAYRDYVQAETLQSRPQATPEEIAEKYGNSGYIEALPEDTPPKP